MKKVISVLSVVAAFIFQSCTNKDLSTPVSVSSVNTVQEDAAAVISLKSPSPGNYKVSLYVENGDTSTAEFKNYVFTFKANGILIAKTGNKEFTGKWESKNEGRELKLDIKGTPALDDVDKSWDVIQITDMRIAVKDNEGKFGDKLVFTKN